MIVFLLRLKQPVDLLCLILKKIQKFVIQHHKILDNQFKIPLFSAYSREN